MANSKYYDFYRHLDQRLISDAIYSLVTRHKENMREGNSRGSLKQESERETGKGETTTAFWESF